MSEPFKYSVGEFVRVELNDGIYQIVKQVPKIKNSNPFHEGNRYYARKIFNGKFVFKAGKAELIHESWVGKLSKNRSERLNVEIENPTIKEFVNNIVLDPNFYYTYYVYLNESAYFIIKNERVKEIQQKMDNTFAGRIDYDDVRIKKIIQSFIENGVMTCIKYEDVKQEILKDNEAFYRMEIGRYENDFSPEENYGNPFYRKIRFVKYTAKK